MSSEDPTAEELFKAGQLDKIQRRLDGDYDLARELESRTIDIFDKSLWLANAGAATVTIGYITTTSTPTISQFLGCCVFVGAIVMLLGRNFIGETNAVRDRVRRKLAMQRFFSESQPMSVFERVRDKNFAKLAYLYKFLKASAAVLFVAGCVLTLVGVYPTLGPGDGGAIEKKTNPVVESTEDSSDA